MEVLMPEKKYVRTTWVDNSEPGIDAEHLNNIEAGLSGLYEPEFDDSGTVAGITSFPAFLSKIVSKMNPIAFYKDFKAGMAFVLHAGQLVNNGLCNEPGKYPLDAAFGKTLQDQINTQNSNLDSKANADTVSGLSADLNNVKESLSPLKTSLVGDINNNTVGVVNIVAWDSNTTSTPKSTGNTIYGNGFCLTYSTGNQWLCQLAMAVGDSHIFTRHRREGVWSGWTTIGTPSN